MKEYLDKILTYGPSYFTDLVKLLTGVKRFLASQDKDDDVLKRALAFWLFSQLAAFLLELPFAAKEQEVWLAAARTIIFFILMTIFGAVIIRASFMLVRGKGNWNQYLVPTLYVSAIGSLIWVITAPISKGIVLANEPSLYPLFKEMADEMFSGGTIFFGVDSDKYSAIFQNDSTLLALYLIQATGLCLIVWNVAFWGAFRAIARVSRTRSLVAYVLYNLMMLPAWPLIGLTQRALRVTLF